MTQLIFLLLIHRIDSTLEIVIIFLSLNHLCRHVKVLKNTIIADHTWHDHEVPARLLQGCKCLQNPSYGHVTLFLAIEFARAKSLLVLVDCHNLVIRYQLLQHLAIDIIALQGLTCASTTCNVSTTF